MIKRRKKLNTRREFKRSKRISNGRFPATTKAQVCKSLTKRQKCIYTTMISSLLKRLFFNFLFFLVRQGNSTKQLFRRMDTNSKRFDTLVYIFYFCFSFTFSPYPVLIYFSCVCCFKSTSQDDPFEAHSVVLYIYI